MWANSLVLIYEQDLYSSRELNQFFGPRDIPFIIFDSQRKLKPEVMSRVSLLVLARGAISKQVMSQFPGLREIVKWGRGVDRIDLKAATHRGIVVVYVPYAIQGVAEAALLLMLALSKNLQRQIAFARVGQTEDKLAGTDLHGKTLGIIGFGAIGQALAKMAQAMGMRLLVHTLDWDPELALPYGAELLSLDDLLQQSDYISLHATANLDEQPILNSGAFLRMKPGAFLINTARGSLIDEQAMIHALQAGKLAGVGLDVVSDEPIRADNPFLHLDNAIVTPHMLGFTQEAHHDIKHGVWRAIELLLEGDVPPNIANPEVLPIYKETYND